MKKPRQRYDCEYLKEFCKLKNIELLKVYDGLNLTRDTMIEYKDKNGKVITKRFRCLVECKNIVIQHYDNEFLETFCKEKGLVLLKVYEKGNVTRETMIEAQCTMCPNNMVSKTFRDLVDSGNTGCIIHKEIISNQKRIDTNLERHNVENPMHLQETKDKIKATNQKNLGVDYPMQSEPVKQKSIETSFKHFGVRHPTQTKEVQFKKEQTCFKNHGVRNPTQSAPILEKALKNSCARKEYRYPSGRIDLVQGYEPLALNDLLLQEQVDENDIITALTQVPKIEYTYNNVEHRYFVDIYIPHQHRTIEVKSEWTFERDKEIVLLKQQAMIDAGFQCEIWVYNKNFERVAIY